MIPDLDEVDVVSKFSFTPRARFVDWSGEISSLSKITPWTLDSSGTLDGRQEISSPTSVTASNIPLPSHDGYHHRNSSSSSRTSSSQLDAATIILEENEKLEQVLGKHQEVLLSSRSLKEGGEVELYYSEIASAYARISEVFSNVKSHHQAIELYQEALEIRSRIVGRDYMDSTSSTAEDAVMEDAAHHALETPYGALLQTHRDALDTAIQIHGKDHPLVATRYHRLANILHQHGKLAEAVQMFQQAFMVRLKTLGTNYLQACTAILYSSMADLLSSQTNDKIETVSTFQKKALETFTRVLEPNDRWLRTMYRKLGDSLMEAREGNDDEALTMYQGALKLELKIAATARHGGCEEVLQESALICKRIGTVLRKQGNHDFAMKMFEEAIRIKLKTQKRDYQGRIQTKLNMYQEYLDYTTNANGRWHPSVAMVCIRMGHLWNADGKYSKAIQMYEKGLEIRLQFFGQDHLDTAVLSNTLADVLAKAGRWNDAIKYYKKSLDTFSAALGPYDPWVRITYTKMENIFIDQDKHDQALMMHKEVFRYELQESRYTATSKLFWGTNDDDEDFATKLYKNLLEMRATALAPEYPDAARLFNALGDLLFGQHKWKEAFEMYQEAHEIETACLGNIDHPDKAATSSILEKILKHRENEDEAVEAYHKVLGIGLQAHVHDHPLIAARYHRIGNVLNNQGRYKEAMNMYQEALEIRLTKLGYDHPDTTLLYNHMGHALANQGSYLEATRMFKRALQIWNRDIGEDHPLVLSIYLKMVDMLFEQRKVAEAEELYKEKIEPFRNALRRTTPSSHT